MLELGPGSRRKASINDTTARFSSMYICHEIAIEFRSKVLPEWRLGLRRDIALVRFASLYAEVILQHV